MFLVSWRSSNLLSYTPASLGSVNRDCELPLGQRLQNTYWFVLVLFMCVVFVHMPQPFELERVQLRFKTYLFFLRGLSCSEGKSP